MSSTPGLFFPGAPTDTLATLQLLQLAVAVGKLERQGDSDSESEYEYILPLQTVGGQQENMEKCMDH